MKSTPTRSLTREEGKKITRGRLLEAAARLLRETGYGGLSASAVAREAGIAQPTFYVHFRDKDDLVRTLAEEQLETLRKALRDARKRVEEGQGVEAVRETFRIPLVTLLENPDLFRLYVQQLHQPSSPIADQARKLYDDLRGDLAEDLARIGVPSTTPAERERVEMIAESLVVLTETLGLGHLEGRYPSLDAVVDVLTEFALVVIPPSLVPMLDESG